MKAFAGLSGLILLVGAASAGASPPIVTVEVSAAGQEPEALRAAVGRELAMSAVSPEDPRAGAATGHLSIVVRATEKTLTVSYWKAERSVAVSRTVTLPDLAGRQVAESSAFLAGNVARDQAGELLETLRKRPAPPAPPPREAVRRPEVDARPLAAAQDQVAAYAAYTEGARAYRDTLAAIVRLHYETKKQSVLSGLDREIAEERSELKKARDTAIHRLEAFVAEHRGRDLGDEVPDAMYRLAALYEERAAEEDDARHDPTIRLYKRILRDHPAYRERAAVLYHLGHALAESGRLPESQQVWRALVCANRYAYPMPADPRDPERDVIVPMPQDGDTYVEVYPASCAAAPPPARADGGATNVAEVWWQIGNWEFDQLDPDAGAFGYARAASAYTRALGLAKAPIYGVSLYKYAWTLFKQRRYEAATKAFVDLLRYTDEQERTTGDRGVDFRDEAWLYIAGALTAADFEGPPASAPFVLQATSEASEQGKLDGVLERLADPRLVPQDRRWTIDIHRAVAVELRGLGAFGLAARVYETMLRRWPLDPAAPDTEVAIAETYDELAATLPSGSEKEMAALGNADAARARLARYVSGTAWATANAERPTTLENAARLARTGLRQVAARHTHAGRVTLDAAEAAQDGPRRIDLLARAAAEYALASDAWTACLVLVRDGEADAYEAQYWGADARHRGVLLALRLHELAPRGHREPSPRDFADAVSLATLARDSQVDSRYVDNAAFFVVDLADARRRLAYAHGTPQRDQVAFDGPDPRTRRVVEATIPPVVMDSIRAREAYVEHVPADRDPSKRAVAYRYWVADTYFLYGQWPLARERFEAIWRERCGVDGYGFQAWERLLTMATTTRDEARAIALLDAVDASKGGTSCDASGERRYAAGIRAEVTYEHARRKLEEARAEPAKTVL
jgi:tetratricopeptide (TPR) repeat protein